MLRIKRDVVTQEYARYNQVVASDLTKDDFYFYKSCNLTWSLVRRTPHLQFGNEPETLREYSPISAWCYMKYYTTSVGVSESCHGIYHDLKDSH